MSRVTVFGSLHYDILVDAPARPRAGETIAGHAWSPKCGGKGGNQAVAAARAGAAVTMIGAVANDAFGAALLANLDRAGVDRRFVRVAAQAVTGMSVAIFDADGDYGAVIVSGVNLSLSAHDVEAAGEAIAATRVLALQNEAPDAANLAAAIAVKAAGGLVVLNAAPARPLSPALAALIDVIVVNALEAAALAGVPAIQTLHDALAAAGRLSQTCPGAVVTAGGAGVAFAACDGTSCAIEAQPVRVASTHGAGDEFTGHLAAGLAAGKSMEQALRMANRAAARLVGTPEAQRG